MNSWRRWGRSLSSKEESSSTGAAETRRSFRWRLGLSLAADTEGDGSSSEFRVLDVGRTLLSAKLETLFVVWLRRLARRGFRGQECPRHIIYCPITPSRTPFSLPASNHATFCPNQSFVPLSLYFLVAAAKSRVASR